MILDIRTVQGRKLLPDDTEDDAWPVIADGHGNTSGEDISRSIADRLLAEPTDAVLLAALISSVSEDGWCAGWLHGIEFEAWGGFTHGFGSTCGMGDEDQAVVRQALAAAREAMGGAWVAWLTGRDGLDCEDGLYALDRAAWGARWVAEHTA